MSKTAETIILAGAVVAAVSAIGGAIIWLMLPRFEQAIRDQVRTEMQPMQSKVDETHKQVTVNHHSSEQPTLLDLMDDIREETREQFRVARAETRELITDARTEAREDSRRVETRLDAHLIASAKESQAMWSAVEAVAKAQPPDLD